MDGIFERYAHLEDVIREYSSEADISRLREAFEYSRAAHREQMRNDGSPFISHPLAAAEIVAEMGLDVDSVIAALLHDCIEDTGATHAEISGMFGGDVADIVEGVTKLTRVTYTSKEEEQMENLRKMLMAMARDIRVILIKIADRLHNMRTLEYQSTTKQSIKALETMEIYAPIAHRLGMQKIKWELEDLSILYLDPIGYKEIEDGLKERRLKNESFLNSIQTKISDRLKDNSIDNAVYGRIKHIYSIYRKMYGQNKELSEVMDLYAFRVIVNDIADCYNVLGHIHEIFHPIPGRFKDYISTPKPNMYRSLHTTVIGGDGVPFEVQIRTWEMHHVAEYGVAAHWKYKQGITGKVSDEEKFAWIRRLLESQQDSDAQDFFQALKIDMFADEVFVFTPRGDVINLPAGATPIDFAYSIHSAIGNRMTGAIVNGRIAPYNHILQNGDIVEVLTAGASKGPSRDWLGIVKSPEARNKIRQWFKKEKREENVVHGRISFEAELRRANFQLQDVTREDVLPRVLKKLAFPTLDDMFAAIGYGGLTAQKAVNRIREDIRQAVRAKDKDEREARAPESAPRPKRKPVLGVTVEGIDNCLVKFARCCTPVPGDPIIGFITRGYGVSVHRDDCVNYIKSLKNPAEAGRWVRVNWENGADDNYQTALSITASDRAGLVVDIASALNAMKIRMLSFAAKDLDGGRITVSVMMEVRDRDALISAITRLMTITGIRDIRRAG
ncbi:MAG: bifunctional (p)ppGpp synthetase/guanosine-3',5'-bis(diphosphate) 3'-pyrophosphohydrolase [Oscillospiraceae bacterium]|nr:bifunctional (p)ppGpp synthetase/guanosine-3',5'-bis(diphosphate) 3'-pyrophosphohydrolase [Oscillospiraceae bacterium]